MLPPNFPINTVVLITAAMLQAGVCAWLILSAGLARTPLAPSVKRNWRWAAGILLAGWLIVRLALQFYPPGGRTLGAKATVAFVVFGILAGTLPLRFSTAFRQIVRAMPQTWIIGFHAGRVIGAAFLTLADMKLLPAQFALPAGYGDVASAMLSLVVVYLLATGNPYARPAAIAWNLLGALDFVVALVTGVTYIPPFVRQIALSGASTAYLNYVLIIPAYGVPIMSVFHVYSLHQLFSRDANSTQNT
jgi:hypothetical protein